MHSDNPEFWTKISLLRKLLDQHAVDGLLLRRISSFAWATCGAASYVNTAASEGASALLVTHDQLALLTNNIEAPRLEQEEKLSEQGWEFQVSPWTTPMQALQNLTNGLSLACDGTFPGAMDVGVEISRLRANLTPQEGERFRELSHLCAEGMAAAVQAVRLGMSEYQLASLLGSETLQRGIQPIVNLIATDERITQFRHPLPTVRKLENYAMLVLSGRKSGLVCSISRLVYFGRMPAELRDKFQAIAQVNAAFISNTRLGRSLGEIFQRAQAVYAKVGYPDEWQHHHQGGAVGYESREFLGTPESQDLVIAGQAYAWNPSIAGVKMEDTILVGPQVNEILTTIPGWPVVNVPVSGGAGVIACSLPLEISI